MADYRCIASQHQIHPFRLLCKNGSGPFKYFFLCQAALTFCQKATREKKEEKDSASRSQCAHLVALYRMCSSSSPRLLFPLVPASCSALATSFPSIFPTLSNAFIAKCFWLLKNVQLLQHQIQCAQLLQCIVASSFLRDSHTKVVLWQRDTFPEQFSWASQKADFQQIKKD